MKLSKKQTLVVLLLLLFSALNLNAQSGTYEKKNKNGSYCYISFNKNGEHIKSEIFAWWNTANAQTGSYYGEGVLKSNTCVLKSDENEPDCKVVITVEKSGLKASYERCSTDHLTEDFNGLYNKITDATAGDYIVTASKSYFHKKADATTKLKTYVVKGNKVTLNIDRVTAGKLVYVYYTNPAGKETSGYLSLADLKKVD